MAKRIKLNWEGIPAEARAEVKRMLDHFTTTPQICYAVLRDRQEKGASKAEIAARKEAAELALVRSGVLDGRVDDIGGELNHLDGLAELLEHRVTFEGEDNAVQCGIFLLRKQIQKVQDALDSLFDPPPEKVEEAEVVHEA